MESMKFLQYWQPFRDRLLRRLKRGYEAYGDESFDKPLPVLVDEIQQELEDICGWGLITWAKLQHLKARALVIEEKIAAAERAHDPR